MRHVSTLTLHRLRQGELDAAATAEARAHLATCETCARRLRAQESARAEFELQPVPEALRAANDSRGFLRWIAVGLAAAAAVLLVLLVAPGPDAGIRDVTRTKGGGADVEAWVDTPSGPRALRPSEEVEAGDRIQVRFRRPSHPWVTLAGIDGRGDVEVYGTWTAAMDTADWQMAPFSLRLDETPGDHALVLLFTDDKPTPGAVERVARSREAPPGAELRRLVLERAP